MLDNPLKKIAVSMAISIMDKFFEGKRGSYHSCFYCGEWNGNHKIDCLIPKAMFLLETYDSKKFLECEIKLNEKVEEE